MEVPRALPAAPPPSFELFGHTFYLYGVVMAIAFIAAVFYASGATAPA